MILGGGPTGCELGQAFARLGSEVTLVELSAGLLAGEEPEAQRLIADRLRAESVEVRLATEALRVADVAGGSGRLVIEQGGTESSLPFDHILVATGRRPETADLGLEAVGVQLDDHGAVKVDATMRTTATRVFAAGDVTGSLPFTHVAGHQGRTVVANALFHARRSFTTGAVPWVTFTDPEVARVGLTEEQARRRFGDEVAVAHHDYDDLDRAVTVGLPYGFAKLVGGPHGKLVGATVAAPAGGEAIAGPRHARRRGRCDRRPEPSGPRLSHLRRGPGSRGGRPPARPVADAGGAPVHAAGARSASGGRTGPVALTVAAAVPDARSAATWRLGGDRECSILLLRADVRRVS